MDDVTPSTDPPKESYPRIAAGPGPRILLLCSSGRSGTTLAMRALGSHPRILIRDEFPYESRVFQYFFLAGQAGSGHCRFEPESCEGVQYLPGQPGDALAEGWLHDNARGFARPERGWRSFYQAVAAAQHRKAPAWIAEKAIGLELPEKVLASVPHSRLLFVFRDPRDTFLSMNAFNRKAEHSEGFGAERGAEAMFESILVFHQRFLELKAAGRPVFAVRYESLVRRPAEAAGRLFKWLHLGAGLVVRQAAAAATQERTHTVDAHSTSASAHASIGRWRREATPAERRLFARFRDDLTRLGYAKPAAEAHE